LTHNLRYFGESSFQATNRTGADNQASIEHLKIHKNTVKHSGRSLKNTNTHTETHKTKKI